MYIISLFFGGTLAPYFIKECYTEIKNKIHPSPPAFESFLFILASAVYLKLSRVEIASREVLLLGFLMLYGLMYETPMEKAIRKIDSKVIKRIDEKVNVWVTRYRLKKISGKHKKQLEKAMEEDQ